MTTPTEPTDQRPTGRREVVETARGQFGVTRHGTPGSPLVVLLHPLALSGAFWDPLAAALAERADVVALDARGHGRSAWDHADFTVEDMAADTAAVIAAVGGGRPAAVAGMSMGGCTTIALAERHPEAVGALVLADTTSNYGPGKESAWAERAVTAVARPRRDQLAFQVERWFSDGFRETRPDEVQRVSDIFAATDSAVHAAAARALGGFDGDAGLAAIAVPTWVLAGEEDYATPPAMAEHLATHIPGARFEVLTAARHLSLLERDDRWPELADFLTGA